MSKIKISTRGQVECPVFGAPAELCTTVLPTFAAVSKAYQWVRLEKKKLTEGAKEPTFSEISEDVENAIEVIWRKASIPVVGRKRITQLLKNFHDKYMNLMKSYKRDHLNSTFIIKLEKFREEYGNKLFDIASCKCQFEFCTCERSRKIPKEEQEFLEDQRSTRSMVMGSLDVVGTRRLKLKLERKEKESARAAKHLTAESDIETSGSDTLSEELPSSPSPSSDDDIELPVPTIPDYPTTEPGPSTSKFQQRMNLRLPAFARTCDRFGVSDRSAAALASAVLEDIGFVTEDDKSKVIDRSKIRRERKFSREEYSQTYILEDIELHGLFFDGRKDKTLIMDHADGVTSRRRTIVEEHISLVREPGSSYLGHVTPTSGSAENIKISLTKFLTDRNINTNNIQAIGCDGTNVNTGKHGGVIRLLELEFKRPLQWIVCSLHGNELPLRHLMEKLDGSTTGPRGFSGPIGKKLINCEELPVVTFEPIDVEFLIPDARNLSTDQQYLLDISKAVVSGECTSSLVRRSPGKLAHSRWVTTANRILRLYVATKAPSSSFKELVNFVMHVYIPSWFAIKCNPSCIDGAKHVWNMLHFTRYLSEELKEVVDPVLQRNSYFAHPENILLAMIHDERKNIRELGVRRIINARKLIAAQSAHETVRQFTIPTLNFDAADYVELIPWDQCVVTEPPLTSHISDKDLELFVDGDFSTFEIKSFPSHTQSVERTVKIVTEASSAVCGELARDGFIRARLESRQLMPHFNTKAEYRSRKEK